MAKAPPNTPEPVAGARVTLCANSARSGTLTMASDRMWCFVKWDDGKLTPKIVHLYELMAPSIDVPSKAGV